MLKTITSVHLFCACFAVSAANLIQSIEPSEISYGKHAKIEIQGQWSQGQQLALKPAGPAKDGFLQLDSPARLMATDGKTLAVVTDDGKLLLLNSQLKKTGRVKLSGVPTALALHGNKAAVAIKHIGMQIHLSHKLQNKPVIFSSKKTITYIALDKHFAYLVLNHHTLQIIELATMKTLGSTSLEGSINHIQLTKNELYFTGSKDLVGVIDIRNKKAPSLKTSFKGNFTGHQIQVKNQLAYVANAAGMVVLDVGQEPIRWLGSHNKLGHIKEVLFDGELLVVNDRNQRLASLNIKNPELPITGSFYKPNHPIKHSLAMGHRVYIATEKGLERVNFSKSATVQISNEGINQGGSRRAYVQDKLAYVADWFSGLHIYDMSDPAKPKHLANYHTPGSSKGVVVKNNIAYVGDDDHGLQILDVSDPANPKKISEILSTGLAYTMKMVGNLIYLADHRGGFHIIEVGNPRKPKIIGSYDTPGKSWAIDVAERIAYIADDTSGLLIFDVSNSKQPRQIGQFNPNGYAEDVLIRDGKAYVSFFDKGLYILDVTQPTKPKIIGHTAIPGNARSISVKNNYAYIAGWESGLQVVDISTPSKPTIAAYLDTDGSAWGLDLEDHYVYLWDWWGGVKVIDVKNPLAPHLIGQYHGRGQIKNLSIEGNFLFSANQDGGMQVFDINNPLNPIWANGVDFEHDIVDIWTNGSFAYLAGGEQGLFRVNISNPFYVKKLTPLLDQSFNINSVQVKGHGALLAIRDKSRGLFLVDTNRTHIKPQHVYSDNLTDFFLSEYGLLVSSHKQLKLYSTPGNHGNKGKLLHSYTMDNKTGIVRAKGKTVAVVEKNKGIHLLQIEKSTLVKRFFIPLQTRVFDINFDSKNLYVGSQNHGLLTFNIGNVDQISKVRLVALYPASSHMTAFRIHQGAAFFAGEKTIHSLSLLPDIRIQARSNHASIHIPAFMPVGEYQLLHLNQQGQIKHNSSSFTVKMKKPKKPKFSMEDFKKIMKQKKLKSTVE